MTKASLELAPDGGKSRERGIRERGVKSEKGRCMNEREGGREENTCVDDPSSK